MLDYEFMHTQRRNAHNLNSIMLRRARKQVPDFVSSQLRFRPTPNCRSGSISVSEGISHLIKFPAVRIVSSEHDHLTVAWLWFCMEWLISLGQFGSVCYQTYQFGGNQSCFTSVKLIYCLRTYFSKITGQSLAFGIYSKICMSCGHMFSKPQDRVSIQTQ